MKSTINGIENLNGIFICPECGHDKSQIDDTRMDSTNTIKMRRHHCKKCGYGWNTAEILCDDLEYLLESNDRLPSAGDLRSVTEAIKKSQDNIKNYISLIDKEKESISNTIYELNCALRNYTRAMKGINEK